MRQKEQGGFTLIELLVVIAIISLLVSILIPSLQKAKELAKSTACMSSLHNLYTAFSIYATDHNGNVLPTHQMSGSTTYKVMWKDRLFSYVGRDRFVYKCAADDHFCPTDDVWGPIYGWDAKHNTALSYGYNGSHVGWHVTLNPNYYNLSDFKDVDKTVVFADSYGFQTRLHPDWPRWSFMIAKWSYLMEPRHYGNANIVFMDGAVRPFYTGTRNFCFGYYPDELK